MTDKPVSPLRQRMIEDMTVRHFKEKAQKDYIHHVTNFKDFLGRSPDTATSEDLRLFQLHMSRNHVGAPSVDLHLYGAHGVKGCFWGMQFSFVSCCRNGVMRRAGCGSGSIETFRGELRQTGADLRATYLYSGDPSDPDHDAVMRIGTKFRGGGPNLQNGI